MRPLVTVVVPARNEEADLEDCLAAIAAQDWPLDQLEVIVVDGVSSDATATVAQAMLAAIPLRRGVVVCNPLGTTPTSLNVALNEAKGDILCRVDARSLIPPDYVSRCVDVLRRPDVAVVGGAQVASTRQGASRTARGIARALRNPWAMGGARYRRRSTAGPTDTVYLGAFRTDQLRLVGGWDERLATNQDYELNRRLSQLGVVWFEAGIDVGYRPRATFRTLAQQYRRFGRWKAAGWVEGDVGMSPRHVALVAAPVIVGALGSRLLRRRPFLGALALCGVAVAVDSMGEEPAPMPERAVAVGAMAVVAGTWWAGVVEQLLRRTVGQRLLPEVVVQGSPTAGAPDLVTAVAEGWRGRELPQ